MKIKEFINEWNASQDVNKKRGVQMMAWAQKDDVYGVEVRFNAKAYRISREIFGEVEKTLSAASNGMLVIYSSYNEFCSGGISLMVAFCNEGYDEAKNRRMPETPGGGRIPRLPEKVTERISPA